MTSKPDPSDTTTALETIHLPHLPPSLPIYAALYKDVRNASFLHSQLLQGNPEFEYAFIDARTILSRRHALAAVFRAVNDYLNGRLQSRNVHSEIVFCLGMNNNIGEAFRRFGVQADTTELLVLKVGDDQERDGTERENEREKIGNHLGQSVEGTVVAFDDGNLKGMTDLQRVRKVFKLGSGRAKGETINAGGEDDEERKDVEVQVLGLMALRGTAR